MTAIVWAAHGPSDPYTVALSFDGECGVMSTGEDSVHYSSDFGVTWSDVTPDTPVGVTGTFIIIHVAISDDGSKIAAVGYDDVDAWVFVSDDAGATWNQGPGLGFNNPVSFVISGSGQYMAVGEGYSLGDVYYSDDGGVTWSATGAGTGTSANALSISQNGAKMVFLSTVGNTLNISSDNGATWSTPTAPAGITTVALSTDGATILIGTSDGHVHRSPTFGSSWVDNGYQCDNPSVTLSGDGLRLMATDFAGAVRVSEDGGDSWGDQTSLAAVMLISEDGERIIANDGAGIYVADFEGPEVVVPEEPVDPDGGATSPVTPADGSVQANPGLSAVMVTTTIVPPIVFGERAIAWSEPLKLFVGSVDNKIYTSADGINWTLKHTALAVGTTLGGPSTWGNGKFIVTGLDGALFTSTDGTAWVPQPSVGISNDYPFLGEKIQFTSLMHDGDKFVGTFDLFGAYFINNAIYSIDGLAWTRSVPFTLELGVSSRTTVAYSPERELHVTTDGSTVFTSTDAITWAAVDLDAVDTSLSNTVWNGELFVSVDQAGNIFTSPDAFDWTKSPSAMGIVGHVSLVLVNDVIVGVSEGRVFISRDAQVWDKYVVPEVSGSAQLVTDNIRGYAYSAASLTIIYLAAGANMKIPKLQILATGYLDSEGPIVIGRTEATIPSLFLTASGSEDSNARVTLPALRVLGYGSESGAYARVRLPKMSVIATGSRGSKSQLRKSLPALSASAFGGGYLKSTLPKLRTSAAGTAVVIGRANIRLPRLTLMGGGDVGSLGQARVEISQGLTMEAYGGAQAKVAITAGLQVLATGGAGAIGRAQFRLPLMALVASGGRAPTGGAEITLPKLRTVPSGLARMTLHGLKLYAIGHAEIDVEYEAYAVNLLNGLDSSPRNTFEASVNEVTHYTNYPFKQIVAFNGQYYGVADDGLHVLGGDTDAGEPIAWSFRTALSDMKSKKLKRLVSVYTGGRVIEGMEVTLVVGEAQDLTYTYTTPRGRNAQNYRTMFGKGVRTRWAALQYSDPLGKAVMIDSIDIETEILERAI